MYCFDGGIVSTVPVVSFDTAFSGIVVFGVGVAFEKRPTNGDVSCGVGVVLFEAANEAMDAWAKGIDDFDYGAENCGRYENARFI